MKPRPQSVYHQGACHQYAGEGDVLTIFSNPLDQSLCGDCPSLSLHETYVLVKSSQEISPSVPKHLWQRPEVGRLPLKQVSKS